MSRKEKILLFIPTYNCEAQIGRVISKLRPEFLEFISGILVVDNGSKDQTREASARALAKIKSVPWRVIQNRENVSLGGSHKVAFREALDGGFDYCIVLHGDDQGSPEDLLPYLKSGDFRDYDNFLGARFAPGSRLVNYSRFRTFGNYVMNYSISLLLGRSIYDMGSGLNVYRVEFLRDLSYRAFPNDLTFNVYLLVWAIFRRSSLKFFPLTWREEDQVSNAKIFRQAWRIVKVMFQYSLQKKTFFANLASQRDRKYEFVTVAESHG